MILLVASCMSTETDIPEGEKYLPSEKLQLEYPEESETISLGLDTLSFKWVELDAENIGKITYTLNIEIKGLYDIELYSGENTQVVVALDSLPLGYHYWYVKAEGSNVPKTYCTSDKRRICFKNEFKP
ncbi:MAG: hypothetical protein JXA60_12890 [Candidatus Coatesbacteria bacterium]|nr:hypothetical protein [Candidatus Coatesbacteria bacterium]